MNIAEVDLSVCINYTLDLPNKRTKREGYLPPRLIELQFICFTIPGLLGPNHMHITLFINYSPF